MADNFEAIKVEVAGQDSDLIAFYELQIFGETEAVRAERAELIEDSDEAQILQLRQDIMQVYGLSEFQMKQAVARCVGSIVGMRIGKDFFSGA